MLPPPVEQQSLTDNIIDTTKTVVYKLFYCSLVVLDFFLLLAVPFMVVAFDITRYWEKSPTPGGIRFLLAIQIAFALSWYITMLKQNGILHDAAKTGLGLLNLQTGIAVGFIAISHTIGALILQKGRIHTFTVTTFWVGAIILAIIICVLYLTAVMYKMNFSS